MPNPHTLINDALKRALSLQAKVQVERDVTDNAAAQLVALARDRLPPTADLYIAPIHLGVDHRPRVIVQDHAVQVDTWRRGFRPHRLLSRQEQEDVRRIVFEPFLRDELPDGYEVQVRLQER